MVLTALCSSLLTAPASIADTNNCVKVETTLTPAATVYFANAKSNLDNTAKAELDALVESLQGEKSITLLVTGYVSNTGPTKIYKSLSKSRAVNVEKYLNSKGITVKYITKGIGVTPSKSKASAARKTTIEVVRKVETKTGDVPVVNALVNSMKFEAGKSVSLKVAEISGAKSGSPLSITFSPALPEGLTFDPLTGIISGTPKTSLDATSFSMTASNSCGTSTPVTIASVIAPAAPAPGGGGGGGGGGGPTPRSIWIDPHSYANYYLSLIDEENHPEELAAALLLFNGAGIPLEYVDPPAVEKSPTLSLSGDSAGNTPHLGSGTITYSGTGSCYVDNATQRPVFTALGACTIYANIAADGTYDAATSPSIVITLVGSCADIAPGAFPRLTLSGDKLVLTGGEGYDDTNTTYQECVASFKLLSWNYAKNATSTSDTDLSDYAFVNTGSGLDGIYKADYCSPNSGNAFGGSMAGINLANWRYVTGIVEVTFTDGLPPITYGIGDVNPLTGEVINFDAAGTFGNCLTITFDPNYDPVAIPASPSVATTVTAFNGETLTPPVAGGSLVAPAGKVFSGWSRTTDGAIVDTIAYIESLYAGIYYAIWVDPVA